MEKVIHRSESRGFTDQGWLKTYHTFSFGNYYDPRRIHFGALRILNDDIVEGGEGFSSHPHDNMEIISIPLKGELEHGDSMGNISVISSGEIQVMTAGTGVIHNEYNKSADEPVEFLQIWVFPSEYELSPGYSQVKLDPQVRNQLQMIVCPDSMPEEGNIARMHQDGWFYRAEMDEGAVITLDAHTEKHGIYIFVIEGEITIDGSQLRRRDGIGLWEVEEFEIRADKESSLLVMEVPMRK